MYITQAEHSIHDSEEYLFPQGQKCRRQKWRDGSLLQQQIMGQGHLPPTFLHLLFLDLSKLWTTLPMFVKIASGLQTSSRPICCKIVCAYRQFNATIPCGVFASVDGFLHLGSLHSTVFSERELKFMFAICHRASVCRLSSVCRL